MKTALVAGASVVALATVGCGGSHGRVVRGAPPPPGRGELHALEQVALEEAGGAGDPHPTDGVVVPSTRLVAERVDAGAVVDSNQPVYFVLLHGHFTSNMAPPGGKFPTGTILTLTIDARTNEPLDTGIDKRMPDLDAIGKPEPFQLITTSRQETTRAEIEAARSSEPGVFAIFPDLPGAKRCSIPAGGTWTAHRLRGTCSTRVWYPDTHGHGEARVVFRESWGAGRFSSWTMWEELPTRKVLVTKLHGEPAPQLRYAAE